MDRALGGRVHYTVQPCSLQHNSAAPRWPVILSSRQFNSPRCFFFFFFFLFQTDKFQPFSGCKKCVGGKEKKMKCAVNFMYSWSLAAATTLFFLTHINFCSSCDLEENISRFTE